RGVLLFCRALAPRASLAVAVHKRRSLVPDAIPVGERLNGLGLCNRRVRCAFDYLHIDGEFRRPHFENFPAELELRFVGGSLPHFLPLLILRQRADSQQCEHGSHRQNKPYIVLHNILLYYGLVGTCGRKRMARASPSCPSNRSACTGRLTSSAVIGSPSEIRVEAGTSTRITCPLSSGTSSPSSTSG